MAQSESTPPDPPTISWWGVGTGTSATISWSLPNSNGASVASYSVSVDGSNHVGNINRLYTQSNMAPYSPYVFKVKAYNAVGWSDWGPAVTLSTGYNTCSCPGLPAVTNHDMAFDATWSVPTNFGGYFANQVSYKLYGQYSSGYVLLGTTSAGVTSISIDMSTRSYGIWSVYVTALNPSGESDCSSIAGVTTSGPDGATISSIGRGNRYLVPVWTAPNVGTYSIASYSLTWSGDGGYGSVNLPPTSLSYTVSNLSPNTRYTMSVATKVGIGFGPRGPESSNVTYAVANRPTVSAANGLGKAVFTWAAPSSDMPITGYVGTANGTSVTLTSPYTISGLAPSQSATLTLAAVSAVGTSAYTTSYARAFAAPNAPTLYTISPMKGGVYAQWNTPSSPDTPLLSFLVYQNGVLNQTVAVGTTIVTTTGLLPGEAATISVRASNSAGLSPYSNTLTSNARPPPDAPTLSLGNPGTRSYAVAWDAPATNGTPDSYVMYQNSSAVATISDNGQTVQRYTYSGLTPGVTYALQAASVVTGIGTSSKSAVWYGTPIPPPTKPSFTSYTKGANFVIANWDTVSSGASLSHFNIYVNDAFSRSVSAASTTDSQLKYYYLPGSASLGNLTPGTVYTLNIEAVSPAGTSSISDDYSVHALYLPDTPIITSCHPSAHGVTPIWADPYSDAPITQYYVKVDDVLVGNCPLSSNINLTGLTTGQTYAIKVAASSSVGLGSYSTPFLAKPLDVPLTPSIVSTVQESGAITINMTVVTSSTTAPVKGYGYYINGTLSLSVSTIASTYSTKLGGLTNYQLYTFSVKAYSDAGDSAVSDGFSCELYAAPDAPELLSATPYINTILVSWSCPDGDPFKYVVYRNGELYEEICSTSATFPSATYVHGLVRGESYTLSVAAVNAYGTSPQSNKIVKGLADLATLSVAKPQRGADRLQYYVMCEGENYAEFLDNASVESAMNELCSCNLSLAMKNGELRAGPFVDGKEIEVLASRDGGQSTASLFKGSIVQADVSVDANGEEGISITGLGSPGIQLRMISPNQIARGPCDTYELFIGTPTDWNDETWSSDSCGNYPNGYLYKTGYSYSSESVRDLFPGSTSVVISESTTYSTYVSTYDLPSTVYNNGSTLMDAIDGISDTLGLVYFFDEQNKLCRCYQESALQDFMPTDFCLEEGENMSTLQFGADGDERVDRVTVVGSSDEMFYTIGTGSRERIENDDNLTSLLACKEKARQYYAAYHTARKTAKVSCPGIDTNLLGLKVNLSSSKYDLGGYGNVVGVTHNLQPGRWTTDLSLENRRSTLPYTLVEVQDAIKNLESDDSTAHVYVNGSTGCKDATYSNPCAVVICSGSAGSGAIQVVPSTYLAMDGKKKSLWANFSGPAKGRVRSVKVVANNLTEGYVYNVDQPFHKLPASFNYKYELGTLSSAYPISISSAQTYRYDGTFSQANFAMYDGNYLWAKASNAVRFMIVDNEHVATSTWSPGHSNWDAPSYSMPYSANGKTALSIVSTDSYRRFSNNTTTNEIVAMVEWTMSAKDDTNLYTFNSWFELGTAESYTVSYYYWNDVGAAWYPLGTYSTDHYTTMTVNVGGSTLSCDDPDNPVHYFRLRVDMKFPNGSLDAYLKWHHVGLSVTQAYRPYKFVTESEYISAYWDEMYKCFRTNTPVTHMDHFWCNMMLDEQYMFTETDDLVDIASLLTMSDSNTIYFKPNVTWREYIEKTGYKLQAYRDFDIHYNLLKIYTMKAWEVFSTSESQYVEQADMQASRSIATPQTFTSSCISLSYSDDTMKTAVAYLLQNEVAPEVGCGIELKYTAAGGESIATFSVPTSSRVDQGIARGSNMVMHGVYLLDYSSSATSTALNGSGF